MSIKKKIWYSILFVLFVIVLTQLDLQGMWAGISQIPLWTAALLVGLQIASQLLVNAQWYQVARFSGARISFREMFLINCQGAVVDSVTPGVKVGGEVTRAMQISRRAACSVEQAAAVVAVQKLFSLSAFFFINLFAAGFIISGSPLFAMRSLHFAIYGILVVFLLLMAFIFIFPHSILAYLSCRELRRGKKRGVKMQKLMGFVQSMLEGLICFRKNSKAWILQLVLSFAIWLLYPVKMYLLAIQFYPDASLIFLSAATFAAYLVAMIPLFPGGLGGFEGTMAGLLFAGGFMQNDAMAIAIVFRFFTFWFVMLLSLVYIGFERWAKPDKGTVLLSDS